MAAEERVDRRPNWPPPGCLKIKYSAPGKSVGQASAVLFWAEGLQKVMQGAPHPFLLFPSRIVSIDTTWR